MVVTIDVERAIALIRTHFPAAWSEESAGPEVAPECVQVTVCLHGVHITSKPTKSMDEVLGGSFGIHPRRGARGNRDRGVVALGPTADVGLSQDARTVFVAEPFANGLLTKSPDASPIRDWIVPLLKGLRHGNPKRTFSLVNHRQPLCAELDSGCRNTVCMAMARVRLPWASSRRGIAAWARSRAIHEAARLA